MPWKQKKRILHLNNKRKKRKGKKENKRWKEKWSTRVALRNNKISRPRWILWIKCNYFASRRPIYLPAHLNICHYCFTPLSSPPSTASFLHGKRDPVVRKKPDEDDTMRNNEEKRFQPPSRSLRCIFILPRYIFHRRYRLENPARHCWRVVASLRRKNVAAAVSLLLARNSTDDHTVRTPICTVVHKTDGISRSRHHTVETNTVRCVCIERWRLIPALEANVFAFHVFRRYWFPRLVNEIEPHIWRLSSRRLLTLSFLLRENVAFSRHE